MCCLAKWGSLFLTLMCLLTLTYGQATHQSCGRRKIKTTFLIQKGVDAIAGHWPWHVAIYQREEYKCVGSIIDENVILTAAHCVYTVSGILPTTRVSVHVGRVELNKTSEYMQVYDVQEIIVHPGFSRDSILHDIALIKLSSNITMNRYVQPVCLWTMDNKQELIVGKNGTIVGFGLNEQEQALIEVLDPLTCIQLDRNVFGTHLTGNIFCGIGQAGVSACNGDSGGGMFFQVRGKWFVRGLVSFISVREYTDLCDPLKPTAYTDVAKYLDWIKQYVDQRVLVHESDGFDIDYEEKLRLFNFTTCGKKSSTSLNDRKLSIPWIGFVLEPDDPRFWCVVTLISDWYAVGPANCFETVGADVFISFGGPKATCYEPDGVTLCSHPEQLRKIRNITKHPEFDRNNFANNIALIELLTPVDTTHPYVKPVCMPVTPELRPNAMTNLHVSIHNGQRSIENIPIRYMDPKECMARYTQGKALTIEKNRLCGEKANDLVGLICSSYMPGSPLQEMKLFNGTERYFFRGFDLFGMTCTAKQPTIFLNAEPYLDWLLYHMRYNALETANETLESEWSTLQQQTGKEKRRLFNMNLCGIASVLQRSVDHVPWIGFLMIEMEQIDKYAVSDWNGGVAVLISEWYALAPKAMVQQDKVWRYLLLGKNNNDRKDEVMHQYVEIKNIIIPAPDDLAQAFALIELLEPANLKNPYIKPICLPFMKGLHQLNSTEVVLSSKRNDYEGIRNKNLTVMDRSSCQDRLLWNGVSLNEDGSTCATEPDIYLQESYLEARFGSPFQMHVQFEGRSRYFLYGVNVHENDTLRVQRYGVYLFGKIELANLEWIVANVQVKERKTSFLTTKRDVQMNLRPVKVPASKRSLFNLHNCGVSSSSYPTPWIGRTDRCLVVLISEWYVVGPARCFNGDSKGSDVVFGGSTKHNT